MRLNFNNILNFFNNLKEYFIPIKKFTNKFKSKKGYKHWPGLIEGYKEWLPINENTPIITLQEGATPLIPLPTPFIFSILFSLRLLFLSSFFPGQLQEGRSY